MYFKVVKVNGKTKLLGSGSFCNVYAGVTTFEIEKYGVLQVAIKHKLKGSRKNPNLAFESYIQLDLIGTYLLCWHLIF